MSGVENGVDDVEARPTPPARAGSNASASHGGGSGASHNLVANMSPEMLFKISKKIAQLTKVIYSLNTKNDDLEFDLEQIRASYEETLRRSKSHPSLATAAANAAKANGKADEDEREDQDDDDESRATTSVGGSKKRRSKTPEAGESDTRRELRKARHIMKKLQAKMKAMEEEKRKALEEELTKATSTDPTTVGALSEADLERKVRQLTLERQTQWTRKFDHLEVKNEHLRLEKEHFKRAAEKADKELADLQTELSAARVQLRYRSLSQRESDLAGEGGPASSKALTRSKSVPDGGDVNASAKQSAGVVQDGRLSQLAAQVKTLTEEKENMETVTNAMRADVEKIEAERDKLAKEVQMAKLQADKLRQQLENARKKDLVDKFNSVTSNKGDKQSQSQDELLKLRREKAALQAQLDEERGKRARETKSLFDDKRKLFVELETLKNAHEAEARKTRVLSDRREEELIRSVAEAEKARAEAQARATEVAGLSTQLSQSEEEGRTARQDLAAAQLRLRAGERELQAEREHRQRLDKEVAEARAKETDALSKMGLANEVLKRTESERDAARNEAANFKSKYHEAEAKIKTVAVERQAGTNERVKALEKALEEALVEREEILEAAAKEIEHEKTVALQREQKMMDDFEWKLREIEAESRGKVKEAQRTAEAAAATTRRDYTQKKDEEFLRLSISLRREMEEQMRTERSALRTALESQSSTEKENMSSRFKYEKDRALRMQQKTWEEEKNQLHREKRSLQRKLDALPEEIKKATAAVRAESDRLVAEARSRADRAEEGERHAMERARAEASQQVAQVRQEHQERLKDLEARLEKANSNRYSSMFQMKEEVEAEFSDRMEALRNMYKTELEAASVRLQEERDKSRSQETAMQETITELQRQLDELNAYYQQQSEDYETRVHDLLTRLSEQTSLAQRLQAELDEYEFYEEDEEGNVKEAPPSTKIELERQQEAMAAAAPRKPGIAAALAAATVGAVGTVTTEGGARLTEGGGNSAVDAVDDTQEAVEASSTPFRAGSHRGDSPRSATAIAANASKETNRGKSSIKSPTESSEGRRKTKEEEEEESASSRSNRRSSSGSRLSKLRRSPGLKKRSTSQSTGSTGQPAAAASKKSNCAHQ